MQICISAAYYAYKDEKDVFPFFLLVQVKHSPGGVIMHALLLMEWRDGWLDKNTVAIILVRQE